MANLRTYTSLQTLFCFPALRAPTPTQERTPAKAGIVFRQLDIRTSKTLDWPFQRGVHNSMSVHESHIKSSQQALWAAFVFASLAALALILVNLPYRYEEFSGEWITQSTAELQWIGTTHAKAPIYAGMPLRFYEKWESPSGHRNVFWSTKNLAFNGLLACGLVSIVYCVSRLRYRLIGTPLPSNRKCMFLDALASIVFIAAVSLILLSLYQETQRHRQLAMHPSIKGGCYLSCEVPAILKSKVPSLATKFLSRIRIANTHRPSDACLSELTQLESLNGLLVDGGATQVSHLKMLTAMSQFTSLHLTSIALTDEHVAWIGRIHQLEDLNLSRTNFDGRLLRHLDNLEHLHTVNFDQTPLRLAELGTPAWKNSVSSLNLPRRARGPADHIKLEQWLSLENLSISNPTTLISPETIRIEIANCPLFRRLVIDRVQKHDLIARDLPKFQDISDDVDEFAFFGTSSDDLPRETCIGIVDLENVPSLKEIGVYANELTSIRIINAPSLQLLTVSDGAYADRNGQRFTPIQSTSLQSIVNDIGNCEGPSSLCFDRLNFQEINLNSLTRNSQIRELRFLQSQIDFSQIQQLAPLTRLRSISAGACEASSEDLSWMLESFPELETLDLDIGAVDELALTSRPSLAVFAARPLKRVKRVCVQDVPELEMDIHVACPIDELCVIDAPQLTGLGLASPWPKQARISGLRGLRWFAAGGASVDDSVLESVLYCRSLDRLMLAYPSLSKDSLKNIGGFLELTSLVLPGANIDDSVTPNFKKLMMLREANFDDCKIGTATIHWLLEIESMRRLSINYVELPPEAWVMLTQMKQLNEIEIAGANISDDVFATLMQELQLEHLCIADHKLSNAKFECLTKNASLRLLNVCRCGLSRDQIQRLLQSNESLLVYSDETETDSMPMADSAAEGLSPQSTSDRWVSKERYQHIRLLLANYGVAQDSMLRTSYYGDTSKENLDQALLGWFDSSKFRTLTNFVETN